LTIQPNIGDKYVSTLLQLRDDEITHCGITCQFMADKSNTLQRTHFIAAVVKV